MKSEFTTREFIKYVWEKKNILVLISLGAALISIIASFQVTPMFKSSAIVFPTNSVTISNVLDFQNQYGFNPTFKFGDDEDAEQLIQLLRSERIRTHITEKYNLMEHYDIDPDEKYAYAKLARKYYDLVTVKKTAYMSVEVEVLDWDPQTAADIANDIVRLADTVTNDIKRERTRQAFEVIQKSYNEQMQKVEDSEKELKELKGADLTVAGLPMIEYYHEKAYLEKLRLRYDEAKTEYYSTQPFSYVVHQAYPADQKTYPRKSIIVIISTIGAFIFALVFMIIRERLKQIIED